VTDAATVFAVVAEDACKGVTDCLGLAGLSAGDLAHSGGTVLLKPNLIHHRHPRNAEGWRYALADPRIIRAVADWVFTGTAGRARVIVADAPQTDASFEAISRLLELDELREHYCARGLDFEVLDLRHEEWATRDDVVVNRRKLPGDPRGYVPFTRTPKPEKPKLDRVVVDGILAE
jgi:uncharacterized protein (DUF362 family)